MLMSLVLVVVVVFSMMVGKFSVWSGEITIVSSSSKISSSIPMSLSNNPILSRTDVGLKSNHVMSRERITFPVVGSHMR